MNIDFAIIDVESGGNDNAIGDRNLSNHAYGPMQIRQPVCDDVNARYGTVFRASNLLGHRALSLAIFWLYMTLYATSANLGGRLPTDEDRARIWNGGPSAWKPGSNLYAATTPYWNQVRARLGQ